MKKKLAYILLLFLLAMLIYPSSQALADDPTATPTPTETSTPTPTSTPTVTNTPTPTAGAGAILWADPVVSIDMDKRDAIEVLLEGDPPTAETYVYVVTDSEEITETAWLISIAALDIEGDLGDWNLFTDGVWIGSVVVTYGGSYLAEYYDPDYTGGGSAIVYFPFTPGKKAQYGPLGVHNSWGLHSVDLFGGYNWGSDVYSEAYAATDGDIIWYCDDGTQVTIKVHGPAGDMIYAHLEPGNTSLYNGGQVRQRRSLGGLVAGDIQSSECGYADQPNDQYHLHWGFEPNAGEGDAMMVEGCFLTISTEQWQCGSGLIVGIGGWLVSGSTYVPIDDPDDPGDDPTGPTTGGGHIWDGPISAISSIFQALIVAYLPNTIGLSAETVAGMEELINNELSLANLLLPFIINFSIPLAIIAAILIIEPVVIIIQVYLVVKRMIPVIG